MDPKEIFGKDYNEFCLVDPFNPKNEVRGFISRKSTEFYGALLITHINNKKVTDQLIMGSPKMHYPFDSRADGTRNYRFPSAKKIEVYEKLDGTNILSYFYYAGVDRFLTFKTRLRPFLASSSFGDFFSMWKEVGTPYFLQIKCIMITHNCNLSFELYGARNPHLIVYKVPLTFAFLFGVSNSGRILSPTDLNLLSSKGEELTRIPVVKYLQEINQDYVWNYEEVRKTLQKSLTQEEEGYYSGQEGAVWYLKTLDDRCIQLKCKPDTIEAIHFSQGAGISKNSILATCWNALENTDSPTVEFIKELLLEEFKPEKIEANHNLIVKCLDFIKGELEFRQKVIEEYHKSGLNILLNKVEVMRILSPKFDRNKMRKVYTTITNFG